jgi:putative transposase
MGYRRIRDELDRKHDIHVNDKRILHINRVLQIRSNIKFRNNGCTKNASSPEYTADNVLNREFHSDKPNEKWVTDVTEFKYGETLDSIHKLYLSAILDLCDRRPVSFIISEHNNNQLVFDTFDAAVANNPDAHPLFHSDRGFQYTSRTFHQKLINAGMTQSMSRVAHCIDNGLMEGFWGILKREMYYGKRYTDRNQLVNAIVNYMDYYTNKRLQRNLSVMTPMEYHERRLKAS